MMYSTSQLNCYYNNFTILAAEISLTLLRIITAMHCSLFEYGTVHGNALAMYHNIYLLKLTITFQTDLICSATHVLPVCAQEVSARVV